MGKRFQRHRPFDCLRFLYPQILHSKRSDPLAALALSKQALRVRATPLLHQVAYAAKTGFASRFVEPVHTPRQSGGRTAGASCSQSIQSLQGTASEDAGIIISVRLRQVKAPAVFYFTIY